MQFVSALKRAILGHKVIWGFVLLFVSWLSLPNNGTIARSGLWLALLSVGLLTAAVVKDGTLRVYSFAILFGLLVLYSWLLVPGSPLPVISLNSVLVLVPYLLLFLVFSQLIRKETDIKVAEDSLIAFVFVLCVLELAFVVFWLADWVDISGTIFSVPPIGFRFQGVILAGANFTAAFLNLVFPLIVIRLFNAERKRKWWILLILSIVIFFFTSSRGGWLAALLGTIVALGVFGITSRWGKRMSETIRQIAFWLRAKVIPIVIGLLAFALLAILFWQQAENTPGHRGLLSGRETIWANSLMLWTDSAITGQGLGSFPLLYANLVGLPPGWLPIHAHNLPLQVGVELGLVGILFVLVMVGFLARVSLRLLRLAISDPSQRGRISAYAGIAAAMLLANMGDFFFHIPIYTLAALLLISGALSLTGEKKIAIPRWVGTIALILIGAAFIVGSMYATRGLDDYVKGGWALESGDLAGATTSICSAAQQAPDVSIYQFQCGVLLAREYFQYKNADALSSAIRSFQTGLAIDPYWPVHKANLAILLRQQGKYEETYAYLKEVTQQSPNNSLFTINLGFMAEIIGERASAKENYAHLLEIDPWIRLTDFFTWRPEMLPSDEGTPRDEIVFRLIDARIDIESRKFRSAAETLETILIEEPNDPEALALFALIAQELGDPDAWFLAQKSIFIDGDNPRTLIWVSQVARAVGEDETAARWIHQAFSIWASKREYDSEIFYSIYDPSPVVSSFIPGYVRADLSAEVEEAFLWLANHFQQTGREEKADALLLAIGMEMDVGPTR